MTLQGWEGDGRSVDALAMCHRLCGLFTYGLKAYIREMSTPPKLNFGYGRHFTIHLSVWLYVVSCSFMCASSYWIHSLCLLYDVWMVRRLRVCHCVVHMLCLQICMACCCFLLLIRTGWSTGGISCCLSHSSVAWSSRFTMPCHRCCGEQQRMTSLIR